MGFTGQRLSLNCSICAGSITVFWIVDGMDSISLVDTELMAQNEVFQVSSSVLKSRFSFTAISVSSHTIQCVVYGPDLVIERSDPITIPVQGNLIIYLDTCTMMCSDTKEYPLKLSGYSMPAKQGIKS